MCTLCPRNCNADRISSFGLCKAGNIPRVAKSLIHFGEEPCISGKTGSGAVFFSGCNLKCVYCQNYKISECQRGEVKTQAELVDLFFSLRDKGAGNINLVTPTPHIPSISSALLEARERGLNIPIIYNTSSYESVEALKTLDGLVDVYLPDLKYFSSECSLKCSGIPDYFEHASRAVLEMSRQVGGAVFSGDGMISRGLVVRHLVLPGMRIDSFKILDFIRASLPDSTYVSLMAQYFPEHKAKGIKGLNRRVTTYEYESVKSHFFEIGLSHGYMQSRKSAGSEYVPDFSS
jgi:putative pyruvate formate lyase activating enzyme